MQLACPYLRLVLWSLKASALHDTFAGLLFKPLHHVSKPVGGQQWQSRVTVPSASEKDLLQVHTACGCGGSAGQRLSVAEK